MPGRSYQDLNYRYGFNGQEEDDEWHGEGNALAFMYRIHDPRLGRFLSVDPLEPEYPWNSTYAFAENQVVRAKDLEGAELKLVELWIEQQGDGTELVVKTETIMLSEYGTVRLDKSYVHFTETDIRPENSLEYAVTFVTIHYKAYGEDEFIRYKGDNVYEPLIGITGRGEKPSAAYDYTNPEDIARKEKDDADWLERNAGYIYADEIIQSRDLSAPDNLQSVQEDEEAWAAASLAISPLLFRPKINPSSYRRTKHPINGHVRRSTAPYKSKYKNPAQMVKLQDRTIKSYDRILIQRNGRIRLEKDMGRVIGTREERLHRVVIDPKKRKIVTSFPIEEFSIPE